MAEKSMYRVLVVDDHANWRNLLVQLLERDFEVHTAVNYHSALALLTKADSPFHVVVTDLRLDDRDLADEGGLMLATTLKSHELTTQVIVVTGYPTFETMEKAYSQLSVYRYLLKNPGNGRAFEHHAFRVLVREAAEKAEKLQECFAFVLMPFAEEYQGLYENVIKKTVEQYGLLSKRADDFYQAQPIMDDIEFGIRESAFNIADFSGKNANVFYEVGIAHATQRPVLLITQHLDDVPPSLRQIRHIVYQNRPGAQRLQQGLAMAIGDLRQNGFRMDPLFRPEAFTIDQQLCLVLTTSRDQDCHMAYEEIVKPVVEEFMLVCESVEDIFSTERRLDAIWRRVNQVSLIISDLSNRDPDIFYLSGVCHGLLKDVILLARNEADIPFDLKNRSYIIYGTDSFDAGEQSKKQLRVILAQLLKGKPRPQIVNRSSSENLKKTNTVSPLNDKARMADDRIVILLLTANPVDMPRLQIDEEVRAIDQAMQQGAYRERFDLRPHFALRLDDLQERLLRYQPQIVHFSGHGSEQHELQVQGEQGQAVAIPTAALSDLFRLLQDNLRCVVLNACYSASQAEAIAEHIDCVIGISDAVTDEASIQFAVAFYRALAFGYTVQTAFEVGKNQLDLHGLSDAALLQLLGKSDPTQVRLIDEK